MLAPAAGWLLLDAQPAVPHRPMKHVGRAWRRGDVAMQVLAAGLRHVLMPPPLLEGGDTNCERKDGSALPVPATAGRDAGKGSGAGAAAAAAAAACLIGDIPVPMCRGGAADPVPDARAPAALRSFRGFRRRLALGAGGGLSQLVQNVGSPDAPTAPPVLVSKFPRAAAQTVAILSAASGVRLCVDHMMVPLAGGLAAPADAPADARSVADVATIFAVRSDGARHLCAVFLPVDAVVSSTPVCMTTTAHAAWHMPPSPLRDLILSGEFMMLPSALTQVMFGTITQLGAVNLPFGVQKTLTRFMQSALQQASTHLMRAQAAAQDQARATAQLLHAVTLRAETAAAEHRDRVSVLEAQLTAARESRVSEPHAAKTAEAAKAVKTAEATIAALRVELSAVRQHAAGEVQRAAAQHEKTMALMRAAGREATEEAVAMAHAGAAKAVAMAKAEAEAAKAEAEAAKAELTVVETASRLALFKSQQATKTVRASAEAAARRHRSSARELAATKKTLATVGHKLGLAQKQLATAQKKVAATQKQVATTQKKLATAQKKLAQSEQVQSAVEQAQAKVLRTQKELDARAARLLRKKDRLATRAATLRSKEGRLKTRMAAFTNECRRYKGVVRAADDIATSAKKTLAAASDARARAVLGDIHKQAEAIRSRAATSGCTAPPLGESAQQTARSSSSSSSSRPGGGEARRKSTVKKETKDKKETTTKKNNTLGSAAMAQAVRAAKRSAAIVEATETLKSLQSAAGAIHTAVHSVQQRLTAAAPRPGGAAYRARAALTGDEQSAVISTFSAALPAAQQHSCVDLLKKNLRLAQSMAARPGAIPMTTFQVVLWFHMEMMLRSVPFMARAFVDSPPPIVLHDAAFDSESLGRVPVRVPACSDDEQRAGTREFVASFVKDSGATPCKAPMAPDEAAPDEAATDEAARSKGNGSGTTDAAAARKPANTAVIAALDRFDRYCASNGIGAVSPASTKATNACIIRVGVVDECCRLLPLPQVGKSRVACGGAAATEASEGGPEARGRVVTPVEAAKELLCLPAVTATVLSADCTTWVRLQGLRAELGALKTKARQMHRAMVEATTRLQKLC